MTRKQKFLVAVCCCWMAVCGLMSDTRAKEVDPAARARVKVMFLFKEVGEAGVEAVENTLARAFQQQGYSVLDHDIVVQTLRREVDLLQLYEVEAAKRLGSRLGADIVVSGRSQARSVEKTYSSLGGKKVTVSQANVGAKAILVSSGKVLVAENAYARKPFDITGAIALEAAAEALVGKLLVGIDDFLSRTTLDYRLIFLNISHNQALTLQDALRTRIHGIQQVTEHGFITNVLELDVQVDKTQDLAFKESIFTRLSAFGLGRFEVVTREGQTIYLRRNDTRNGTPRQRYKPTGRKASTSPHERLTSGYRKSWAVVIGINNYQQWPKLAYAVRDAEGVAKRLKNIGFDELIRLFDDEATQRNILQVLGDELYAKTGEDDQVLIFFAGHGQTQDLPNGSKVGYIIPVDGDATNYYSTAISMHQLQELSDRIRAKHIFYIMDSCFSGLLLRFRGFTNLGPKGEGRSIRDMQTARRVRQVLTAGSEGEQVVEMGGHGLFTGALLDALDGAADLNNDHLVTGSELYQFVTPRVLKTSQNAQNPAFGRLDQGQGEFVFVLK